MQFQVSKIIIHHGVSVRCVFQPSECTIRHTVSSKLVENLIDRDHKGRRASSRKTSPRGRRDLLEGSFNLVEDTRRA